MNQGHNSEGMPAEDAVLALNIAKMIAADTLLDGAKADHKAVKEHVDAKGVNLKAYTLARRAVASGAVADHVQLFSDTLKYLKILGRPVQSSQLDLLATEDDATPLDDRAWEEGRYAAFFFKGDDANPYDPTSVAGQRWISGIRQGQSEVKLIMDLEPKAEEHIQSADPFNDDQREAAE